jgi:predicted nucleic acid-binding protein
MFHPTEAYRIVAETIVGRCEVVCLDQADYLATLQAAANSGLRGGIIYDALHVRCAEKARCDRIYTFNIPDFLRVAPQIGKQILRP